MSKIIDVRAVQPRPENAPSDWRRWLGQVGVRIQTDSGHVGYGVAGGGQASLAIINNLLAPALHGLSVDDPQAVWDAMYAEVLLFGRSGLSIMAISGVDLAVWDACAKTQSKSVLALLGTPKTCRIPCYVTAPTDIKEAFVPGVVGAKIAVPRGQPPEWALARLREARTILGDRYQLMVDVGMRWSREEALRFVRGAEDLALGWLEEPLSPDDLEGYALLRKESSIPIAGGEHAYTAPEFRRLFEAQALDIVQPDISWCGGMTELLKVFAMADAYDVPVCPHRGGDMWSLPAIAVFADEPLGEQARAWTPELNGPVILSEEGYHVPENVVGFGVTFEWFDSAV